MGSSGGGSGGSSGKVSWPGYFETQHKAMLYTGIDMTKGAVSMEKAIGDAWNDSPYSGAMAYDPSDELSANDAALLAYSSLVSGLAPSADLSTAVAAAISAFSSIRLNDKSAEKYDQVVKDVTLTIDTLYNSQEKLDSVTEAYAERQKKQLLLGIGRLCVSLGDLGADQSSAVKMAIASMISDHLRDLGDFNAKLTIEHDTSRNQAILQSADLVMRNYQAEAQIQTQTTLTDMDGFLRQLWYKVDSQGRLVQSTVESNRIGLVAQTEYYDKDMEYTVKDHLWNIEIWQHYGNLLAAGQGGIGPHPSHAQPKSGISSMLGGSMGGVVGGAGVGFLAGGPMGALVGAGIGGGMGLLGGA